MYRYLLALVLILASPRACPQAEQVKETISSAPEKLLNEYRQADLIKSYVYSEMLKAKNAFTLKNGKRDLNEARQIWARIGSLEPNNLDPNVSMLIAMGALVSGDFDSAKRALDKASIFLEPFPNLINQETWATVEWESPEGKSLVRICDGKGNPLGSGTLISSDGVILTAAHIVAGQNKLYANLWDGRHHLVEGIYGGDFKHDLALLKIPIENDSFKVLASSPTKIGDGVSVAGFPLGLWLPVKTTGFVINSSVLKDTGLTSLPGLPSMSGGAVLNQSGEIIGVFYEVNTASKTRPESLMVLLGPIKELVQANLAEPKFSTLADLKIPEGRSSAWNKEEALDLLEATRKWYSEPTASVSILESLADRGNETAKLRLAALYLDGRVVPQNKKRGVELLESLANNGNSSAQLTLGILKWLGAGIQRDSSAGLTLLQKAADQKVARAYTLIGFANLTGAGVDKNTKKAADLFQKAAALGDSVAMNFLCLNAYMEGKNDPESMSFALSPKAKDEMFKWANLSADSGDAQGALLLAGLYKDGIGTVKDLKKAEALYKKSAQGGNSEACVVYAGMIGARAAADGLNTQEKVSLLKESEVWSLRGAELGQPAGYLTAFLANWGRMQSEGRLPDEEGATKYLEKAGELNIPEAQLNLGRLYLDGKYGFKKDIKKAIELFEAAVKNGSTEASVYLLAAKAELENSK
jgi:TPR repeat protein